ncbi:MAG TPA: bifunctional 2-polyprenyl-6-hydroxyphenol methylase/3-demethylubiquinol 3-O-methyltransferase UbiG [Thiobacillaceae bacterium]|nr:bifunctional 2-polyprenyl-6-hydroxyphenol methylase/3-demethylubiquinol 3-O-methyltransferase UbiG [Thiobacillaceae bacterium]HNU65308.1 bifunctional 2-polyprenyl-6-hydroxyphenol methylase/3-demethylubiquinol 3-O-methyltransferase UbiG [Thiobacillaceae bacterium]
MSNVDQAELDKFSQLAHRWWDPNSEFKPLHEINPLRLDWVERLCGGLQGKRVVDVGCGGGILAESMAVQGALVTGIDMAEKALKVAMLHQLESGIQVDYRQITAEDLAKERPAAFDVVTCMEMLEHVPDPVSVLEACRRMVKPDGWVFLSTLNRNPKSYLFAIVGAEYVLNLLPKGTHDWSKFIKPHELAAHCRQVGLDPVELMGMTYNPFSKTYRLERDTKVNYLLACRPA